jgi:acyl-CoA synthetase (NDP forming)
MDPAESKKNALTDREAKEFLADYGISFIPEIYVKRRSEVLTAARKLGFPAVVKGIGRNLLHKSDRGLVQLNLSNAGAVETAVAEITAEALRKSPPKHLKI